VFPLYRLVGEDSIDKECLRCHIMISLMTKFRVSGVKPGANYSYG